MLKLSRGICKAIIGFFFITASFSYATVPAQDYALDAEVTRVEPYTVDVAIKTNLPDEAVLSVQLALKGQGMNDVFIGTDFERVTVTGGSGKVTIDGNLRSFPIGENLPPGVYIVETTFYPGWLENRTLAEKIGIVEPINKYVEVRLGQ